MNLKHIFVNSSRIFNTDNPIWQSDLNVMALADLEFKISTYMEDHSKGDIEEFKEISIKLLKDILQAKETVTGDEYISLNFLQLTQSYQIAGFYSSQGLFADSHDWLIYALSDKIAYDTETDFQIGRFNDFLKSSNPHISRDAINVMLEYSSILFYYAWHRGGLVEFAADVLEFISKLINRFLLNDIPPHVAEELVISAATNAIAYAHNYKTKELQDLSKNLGHYYEKAGNPEIKKQISLQLAHAGAEFTDKTSIEWTQIVLENFSELLVGGQLMQLLSLYYFHNIDKLEHDWQRFEDAIGKYSNSIPDNNKLLLKYEKARLFTVLSGVIMKCVERKKIGLASKIITTFYCVDIEKRIASNELFIIGNYNYGVLISSSEKIFELSKETPDSILEVFYHTNRFLSTKIAVNDYPGFVLEEPKNHGVPVKSDGENFEKILSNHYQFLKLKDLNFENLESIIIIPGFQHPIQPLMIKAIGSTIPLSGSFETPKIKKKITRILLWCFGTRTSDLEMSLTKKMFENKGIEVEVINILEANKHDFISKYNSINYDLIWVGTHGNYDHYLPHKSKIEILPEDQIELQDIIGLVPTTDSQRMLFLNICDGATASTLNGIYDIGFGASLCNSNQAVLSHIWMVEIDYSFIYGVIYAHYLLIGDDFFQSYQNTVKAFLNGKAFIANLLSIYYHLDEDLIKHVNNLDEKIHENIYYWGSSVYYQ